MGRRFWHLVPKASAMTDPRIAEIAAGRWHAMESAPHDRPVLLTVFGWCVTDLDEWTMQYQQAWVAKGYWHEERGYWTDGVERLVEPTHWMPLADHVPRPIKGPNGCAIPPAAWFCTREVGHEGPCAAHPAETAINGAAFPAVRQHLQERGDG